MLGVAISRDVTADCSVGFVRLGAQTIAIKAFPASADNLIVTLETNFYPHLVHSFSLNVPVLEGHMVRCCCGPNPILDTGLKCGLHSASSAHSV